MKANERQLVSINIREENGKQTVSARELHEKLEVTERFSSWFDRMLKYGFEENVDFTSVKSFTVVNNGAQKPIDEYYISIDMAKEICMIQRSDKGRMFRQYFIECERRLIETNKKAMPQTYIEAVENLLNELKKNQALEEKGKLLLEQYQSEKEEHQKDKELVLHKYLTATNIKDTIWKEYGKNIIVSKMVKQIPIEDNDILYKPFKNGNFTGQQPVYHPNVLDKIREIME